MAASKACERATAAWVAEEVIRRSLKKAALAASRDGTFLGLPLVGDDLAGLEARLSASQADQMALEARKAREYLRGCEVALAAAEAAAYEAGTDFWKEVKYWAEANPNLAADAGR